MIAVTAVTSTIGLIADSQLGSSGRLYQIRYCATVQASIGPSTSTLAVFSAGDRCGAYMRADAVRRKTTAALNPLSMRSALSRLRRRLGGGANEEAEITASLESGRNGLAGVAGRRGSCYPRRRSTDFHRRRRRSNSHDDLRDPR